MSKAYSRTSTALTICGQREPIHQGELHAHWRDAAAAKGFELIARVADRFHLALRCTTCNGLIKAKLFVVMNNQPRCRHCLERTRRAKAKTAGARYLQRDPKNRHYALYRAPCGHDLLRQINRVKLISAAPQAGQTSSLWRLSGRHRSARGQAARLGFAGSGPARLSPLSPLPP